MIIMPSAGVSPRTKHGSDCSVLSQEQGEAEICYNQTAAMQMYSNDIQMYNFRISVIWIHLNQNHLCNMNNMSL